MRTRVAWGLTPLRTPYPSILTYTHQFFLWVTFMNFIRRHGKRFMAGQCLYLDAEKFGAVGTVSALYRHRAYGNVHISGYTIGTFRQFSYHHAYKISDESRHDELFWLISCLLFTSRLAQDIGIMKHFGPYHAYDSRYGLHKI